MSALGAMHARGLGVSTRLSISSNSSSRQLAGLPLPPRSTPATPRAVRHQQQQQQPARSRRPVVAVAARYRGGSAGPDIAERALAAIPYLLPFLDSFGYGRFLFYQFPIITKAIAPLAPLISLYTSVPFAPLLAFFGVYLGIVQNMQWSRFVRFNAMQAMLLDILLILPRLAEQVFSTPTSGPLLQAYITAQNSIWIFIAASVVYGIGASVLGQAARIPLVADAAEQQVR